MFAVDLDQAIVIPTGVAVIGALVAGASAALNSWFENRDVRRRVERQLDLARKRTEFVEQWVSVSEKVEQPVSVGKEVEQPVSVGEPNSDEKDMPLEVHERARRELDQAYDDARAAFRQARTDGSTFGRKLRWLLMLVRRRNPASYLVSGSFLFLSVFAWLLVCIPDPSYDDFSVLAAVFVSVSITVGLRVVAEMIVSVFERFRKSPAQRITNVSVSADLVTLTTLGHHGLTEGQEVVVDVLNDLFDGTYNITGVPELNEFRFEHRAPNISSAQMTGWVCGDTPRQQLRHLLMIQGGRGRPAYAISGLFLLSLVVVSAISTSGSVDDLDLESRCIGDDYFGGYFGDVWPDDLEVAGWRFIDESGAIDVERYVELLNFPPRWTPELPILIENSVLIDSFDLEMGDMEQSTEVYEVWVLENTFQPDFVLEGDLLVYGDGNVILTTKDPNGRLRPLDDPCKPQTLTVARESIEFGDTEDSFAEYDENVAEGEFAGFGDPQLLFVYYGVERVEYLYDRPREGTMEIDAYFGHDGRLIPVCDEERPEILPCLVAGDVYFDSGLVASVWALFRVSLSILGLAILARILFGALVAAAERLASHRASRNHALEL